MDCFLVSRFEQSNLYGTVWDGNDLHLSLCPSDFSTLASVLILIDNKFEVAKSVFAFDYRARLDDEGSAGSYKRLFYSSSSDFRDVCYDEC